MKPVRIVFNRFGAYAGREEVDFETVGRDGLFLICGDTGAGKTTILDAMCYALYNASSGGIGKSDPGKGTLESMRSRFTPEGDKTPTFVEFILEKNGERYRFYREVKPKPRSTGFDETQLVDKWDGEAWVPLMQNPTSTRVTEKAEILTGLKADQFRQIIILPQGRFEQLLTSGSEEK
nr:SMC family ATPase [Clostridiales bacterium]